MPPVECGAPHPASGITSSQCPHSVPMVTSAAFTRAAPRLSPVRTCAAPAPPRPRLAGVPPPAPRASAAGRRKVAKLARSLAAEHMPSVARGYLVRTVRTRWTKICNSTCQRVCYVEICECIQLFCTTNSKRFSSFQSLILDI